jgi:hypothetical protein
MQIKSLLILASLMITLSFSPNQPRAADMEHSDEEAAVLATVQRFFETLMSKDVATARTLLDPEGDFISVRWDDAGERIIRRTSIGEYLQGLAAGTTPYLERMWDPEVRIRGPIATVWAPYDFHIEGIFSHCGIDAFQLLHTEAGWIITGATYTVERDGCGDSPLGPPGS